MATFFKHNKKRDTGLVYEFLVRKLSQTIIEKDQDGNRRAFEILRKYYGDGTPLAEERELFEVIKSTRGVSEVAARRILAEVQRHAKSFDHKRIDIKKSNLIKEINYSFGKDFFSRFRVPEYRLMASIQMMLDAARTQNRLTESVQKIQLEEGLVRYMMTRGSFGEMMTPKSQVDAVVMALVAKRFNEKYSTSLIKGQKGLLEKYIRAQVTGDEKPLKESLLAEGQRVFRAIDRLMPAGKPGLEVKDDAAMCTKLQEARTKLSEILTNVSTGHKLDESLEEMMLFEKLAEEIESDE